MLDVEKVFKFLLVFPIRKMTVYRHTELILISTRVQGAKNTLPFFFFFFDISVWCLPLPTTFSKTIPLENQFGNKFFHPVPLFVEVQFSYNL